MSTTNPSYTVFVRLPFPRGDFCDPPAVEWDAPKDKALWKILSKASKNSDIDWNGLAAKFDVSLAFLLQQAAWLYERQLLQVRAQMRKVGVSKGSSAPSPIPGSEGVEGTRRAGASIARLAPSLSRRDSPTTKSEGLVLSAHSRSTGPRSLSPKPKHQQQVAEVILLPTPASTSSPEVSSPESSDSGLPAQSRLLRRPQFANKRGHSEDGDEDDDEPAFMPFVGTKGSDTQHDPSATLRGDPSSIGRRPHANQRGHVALHSQTSDSSASSTAPTVRRPEPLSSTQRQRPTGPLSPKRTAELAGRSPGVKGKGRDGSDGTPSMGSSFSDLDDASVTQSALEEALASNMQAGGGMASRMSSISQALRSKYLN